MTATTTHFATRLAAARKADADARKAYNTALAHIAPVSAANHELFCTRPADYARALRAIADIVETLPALTAACDEAAAALKPLEARACWRCDGTGNYQAPTSHYKAGRPVCFKCNGSGEAA